jgi:archaellum component FlaC
VSDQGLKPEVKQLKFGEQFNQKISTRVSRDIVILLYSQSTNSTFYLKEVVVNIREIREPLKMFTNGGSITYDHIADLPGYGTVCFNEKAVANII